MIAVFQKSLVIVLVLFTMSSCGVKEIDERSRNESSVQFLLPGENIDVLYHDNGVPVLSYSEFEKQSVEPADIIAASKFENSSHISFLVVRNGMVAYLFSDSLVEDIKKTTFLDSYKGQSCSSQCGSSSISGALNGGLDGAAKGAGVGLAVGGVKGAGAGAVIGGTIGAVGGAIEKYDQCKAQTKCAAQTKQSGNSNSDQ